VTGQNGRDPVDLNRYKKVVQSRAREAARQQAAAMRSRPAVGGREPIIGSRPRAGLILVLAAAVFLALWLAPQLL